MYIYNKVVDEKPLIYNLRNQLSSKQVHKVWRLKCGIVVVSYCVIWRQSIVSQLATLYLLLCLQVFIISALLFKRLSPLYVAILLFLF